MNPEQGTPSEPDHPLRVLVVDDDQPGRELLKAILVGNAFEVDTAQDGIEALEIAARCAPDVAISDILMPGMDGYQLCMHWRADPKLHDVPFVLYSADYIESDDRDFALSIGAARFLLKPIDPEDLVRILGEVMAEARDSVGRGEARAAATVSLETLQRYNNRLFAKLSQKVEALEAVSAQLHRAMDGCLQVVSAAMESRDPYTRGHEERVSQLATAIAGRLGLPDNDIEVIRIAGMLHDIGKISIPVEILSKPGRLSALEFEMVKTHASSGAEILKHASFMQPIDAIVHQHHERLNGSGYPNGLTGEDILLAARIIAVADVVEAMASDRPYRAALSLEAALDELRTNAGVLYDPAAVQACLWLFESGGFAFQLHPAGAHGVRN